MKNPAPAKRPNYPIESVDNALTLLKMFREQRRLTVSDASRSLGVAPSTGHRLLAMLQYHGFVQQDAVSRGYIAGPVLAELGLAVVRQMDVRKVARPYLERLSAKLGETIHLTTLRSTDLLFLDCVESAKALRAGDRTGTSMPAHCTAAGKVLLADLPTERIRELYPGRTLRHMTPASIGTVAKLLQELEQVRERGWAENHGESEDGLSAVAVPIRDRQDRAVAAMTVAAPSTRAAEDWMAAAAKLTGQAAGEIQHLLA